MRFSLAMVRSKGTVTFVHRADRIDTLLGHIAGRAGEVVVFPLWPGQDRAATRVLVRARLKSPVRRGSPPASSCMSPTAGSPPARMGYCARAGASNSDLSGRKLMQSPSGIA